MNTTTAAPQRTPRFGFWTGVFFVILMLFL
jgi:hypothetical protein